MVSPTHCSLTSPHCLGSQVPLSCKRPCAIITSDHEDETEAWGNLEATNGHLIPSLETHTKKQHAWDGTGNPKAQVYQGIEHLMLMAAQSEFQV